MSVAYAQNRYGSRARPQHGRLLIPLIVGVPLIVIASAFVLSVLWPRWPDPPIAANAPPLPITVAGVSFNIPPAAVRVAMQRQPGAQERVDLNFMWPSLEPPDLLSSKTIPTKGKPRPQALERIFVTIVAARDALAPNQRVRTIYARYAESEPTAGPDGLAVLAFRQGTPYQGEDLIYDATSESSFLARCSRNGAASTPGICLSARRIGGADVTLRFPRDWLSDWHSVAANIERLIARLHSPTAGH